MTALGPHVSAFLLERLPKHQGATQSTCDTYAHALRLFFGFASRRLRVAPSSLWVEHLDADLVLAFLRHLETERGNSASTRNARLAVIRSFMRFMEYREPALLEQFRRVLAIPVKRTDQPVVGFLASREMEALLNVPDLTTRDGIRDRAMIHLCFAAGLRVSELVGLRLSDVTSRPDAAVRVVGKGRKERCLPLWKSAAADLRRWLGVRLDSAAEEVFLNARGGPMSRGGFEYILRKNVRLASKGCKSLEKKRVSPHVLRHTCAMTILHATRDIRKVALWLGHADLRTTQVYLRADPQEKLEAVEAVIPLSLRRGRFRPPDKLIAILMRK